MDALYEGGAKFVRGVDVRISGVSGPSRFVLAEIEVDQESLFDAMDRVVLGPEEAPVQVEPEPEAWWEPVAAWWKSLLGLVSDLNPLNRGEGSGTESAQDLPPAFTPIAGTEPEGGSGAYRKGLSHYYAGPFSQPRDFLATGVTSVQIVPGSLEDAANALRVNVWVRPHAGVIEQLHHFLRMHDVKGDAGEANCLISAHDVEGEAKAYAHVSCRDFTAEYPTGNVMLALNFIGESGVIASLMLSDQPYRVGFGERYLEKFETLYVRHSDAEYAAWAWRPNVIRVRGRDSDYHVMPYSTLECGEDKIGACTDWSRRYRVFLGVHGGTEQQMSFVLENLPTDVLSKTKVIVSEVIEVRKGEVVSGMLPPGVVLIPEDPLPPLSHPLDRGVFRVQGSD